MPIEATEATFERDVIQRSYEQPVVVDFWAEWCGPCKLISPILEEIASERPGALRVVKLNIDENLEISRRFEVMSIPTLILFRDGEPRTRIIGAKGKQQLLQELHPFLDH